MKTILLSIIIIFINIYLNLINIEEIDKNTYIKPNKKICDINNDYIMCNGGKYFQKDLHILIKCYENINYIKNMKLKNITNADYYHYFNIGNYLLTYKEIIYSLLNKKNKNKLTNIRPCLYILDLLEINNNKKLLMNNNFINF